MAPSRAPQTTVAPDARTAAEAGYIAPRDIARLIAFRDNPSDESWIVRPGAPEA